MTEMNAWSKHAPKDDAVKQFDKLFDPPHTGSDVATDLEKEFIHINAQSDSVSSFTLIISHVKP